ncbi:MAG: isoprenylcysteine carboxylmethyltransferase family protein [Rhodoferax sp.]|nr:isoprenylcysteine carboxylmethyltransferase family protein [Rhodoferax sp.]
MKPFAASQRRALGIALVGLQFACLFLLGALAWPAIAEGHIPALAWILAAACVATFLWILMHNRLGNFNFQPAPKQQGVLVTSGPYHWIRHPMYTALLLGSAALASISEPSWAAWAIWLVLAAILWVKSRLEEQWMAEQHAGYVAYMQHSKRFVPWLL